MLRGAAAPRAKIVLVVDDEPHIRGFVAMLLEEKGYCVETATNGREALRKLRDHSPDAILLDLMMPELDGAGFMRECRANPASCDDPILLMSSWHRQDRVEALGAQGVLLKPFDYEVLLAMLATMV